MRIAGYIWLLFFPAFAFAQTAADDSMSQVYLRAETDSARITTLMHWSALSNEVDYTRSLQQLNKALDIAIRSNDVGDQARVIEEIGLVFSMNNHIDSSMFYYDLALQRYLSINDSAGAATACYKMGRVYFYSSDFQSALEFFKRSDAYNSTNPNVGSLATSKMAIGVVYEEIDSIQPAIYYQELALKIKQENNLEIHIPVSLNNLAVLHAKAGNTDKARELLNESMQISERLGEYKGLAFAELSMGGLLVKEKQYREGIRYMEKAVAYWESINSLRDQQEGYRALYDAYKLMGNESKALTYLEKTISIKDSIYSQDRLLSLQEFDSKFKSREKEMTIRNQKLQLEKEVKEKELAEEQKSVQFYFFSAIILVLLLNGVYLVIIYVRKKRDQQLILKQKQQLQAKNTEILDSINYAKRLQQAILPDKQRFQENFSDAFVFYQPKDIVAGDFYWLAKDADTLFFAVADCTGHGVPGAMMSVVCSNALEKATMELKLKDPGKILDAVRQIIVESFNKGAVNVSDGMDISLCAFSRETNTLHWAGANNPVWIASQADTSGMIEVKGDKQPVGSFIASKQFTTHEMKLSTGDQLYLFTDGFADQFGGEKGKKFKYKSLKKLLFENRHLSLKDQSDRLNNTLDRWKGDYEQVDDICIVGIRI